MFLFLKTSLEIRMYLQQVGMLAFQMESRQYKLFVMFDVRTSRKGTFF